MVQDIEDYSGKSVDDPALYAELGLQLKQKGANLFGVADLSHAECYTGWNYTGAYLKWPRALSIGVGFPQEVIRELQTGPTHTYLHYYRVVNARLDDLALLATDFLQQNGFRAFPVPASQRVSRDRLAGIFPHRLAAYLAGLGWIGKHGSLVHPVLGPHLRLVTVLTEALLPPDTPLTGDCGACQRCVEACPAGALRGGNFAPTQKDTAQIQPDLCDQYQDKVRSSFGKRVCGVCLAVCPRGK